jgi:dGTPase
MAAYGGFDHNGQSLRVVTELERRYPRYDGLNLAWETLEGLVKHNGPLTDGSGRPVGPHEGAALPFAIAAYAKRQDLELASHASAEAQAAAIADDIAYNAHDIDDGLRAGLLTLDGLREVPLLAELLAGIDAEYPRLAQDRRKHELIRRLITVLIEDVIGESVSRIERLDPRSVADIRAAGAPVVGLSERFQREDRAIKALLKRLVYRHRRVMEVMEAAERTVLRLFARYQEDENALPVEWRAAAGATETERARRIADFIAGMTDRFALGEAARLFDGQAELS